MTHAQIVVIGASAGGLEALRALITDLPGDFAVPICVVMHMSPQSPGLLHEILGRSTQLSVVKAADRDRLKPGTIYLPPPDCHLTVEPGRVRVSKGPRENLFRPAIDPLFRSAAQVYGPAAIGVILTGNLDDGTAGLWAIKQMGGVAVVQDPADSLFPSMPRTAIRHVNVDHIVPRAAIPALLGRLVAAPVAAATSGQAPAALQIEVDIAREANAVDAGLYDVSQPSEFACPECHGVLRQLKEGERTRFRCHTGHAYSIDSLLAAISAGIEDTLWSATRALEEARLLLEAMADHVTQNHDPADARRLMERAEEARRHVEVLRALLTEREPLTADRS
jgi:two-component system chemotaxis response regulator CheB